MNLPPYGDQYRRTNAHLSSLKALPSPDPDMFVNISPGGFWLSNKIWKEYVGGRSPGFTAPTSNAKWDLLCLHYNGNPMIIEGTPSTDPVLPELERKAFPLAAVYLEAGDTKITSEKIFDLRIFNTTSFSHVDFEDLDHVDSHPITAITGLRAELDLIESGDYWSNVLNAKADIDGTPNETFTLNKDFTGTPAAHCSIVVERGVQPNAEIKFNETLGQWEYTNNGTDWVQLTDQGPSVSLPIASDSVLGGIRVGARATINPANGILDIDVQSTNDFTNTYKDKLDSVEYGATVDQTPAEIKTSYESNADTNSFSDADKLKLDGIEEGATVGVMSNSEVKTAYEANANTNAFTDAEKNKLQTVDIGATDDMTGSEIKAAYEGNSDTNAFTDADKTKLTGIEVGANAYVHPGSHDPTIITQDSNHRFVSDAEKIGWNGKADVNDFWDKTELASTGGSSDRVDWSHIQNAPTFGSEQWLEPVANIAARDALTPNAGDCVLVQDDGDGSAAQYIYNGSSWVKLSDVDWSPMTDGQVKIAYENNSDTNAFSDAEKTKLASIEDSANDFTLEPATDSILGGVMVGAGLSVDPSGIVALDFDDTAHGTLGGGVLHQIASTSEGGFMSSGDKQKLDDIEDSANNYVLPTATDSIIGGVRSGNNTFMSGSRLDVMGASESDRGVVRIKASGNIDIDPETFEIDVYRGSDTRRGVLQVGTNLDVASGVVSVPHAQGTSLGVVKVGDNIDLDDGTGEISIDWAALPFDDSMHGTRLGGNLHALSTTSEHGFMSSSDKTKLDSVESGATGDMTAVEVKTAYESNADTNVFTDTEKSKLTGIEDGATGDMTAGEIKAAYESNADTNAFTDSLIGKLNGIEAAANAYVHPTTHPSTEIDQPVTTVLSVDGGRVDSYTADGSINRPYKTITDAITNAPGGSGLIDIAPGIYAENLVVSGNMHFVSRGLGKLSSIIAGTVLFNTNQARASFTSFVIASDGVNPTVQFYGSNDQQLELNSCIVSSQGLQPALHMNNTGSSILYANDCIFENVGSGLAVLVNGSNGFEDKFCKYTAAGNSRCIEFADMSGYSSYMGFYTEQIKISDTAKGELFHPVLVTGNQDCIQHDGGELTISSPVNASQGQELFAASSTGTIVFGNQSGAVAYSPTTPGDWTGSPTEVMSALDELAGRPSGGGMTWSVYDATNWGDLPSSPSNGEMIFATNVWMAAGKNIPLWWDDDHWVDATGADMTPV